MEILDFVCLKKTLSYIAAQTYMNSRGMCENPSKWYQICSTMTVTCHELDVLHKFI